MADEAADRRARYDAALIKLERGLALDGKLVEAGWVACRRMLLPPDAPSGAVEMGRTVFFSGAQHLFGSIMHGLLDPDSEEPTEADMQRMSKVAEELEAWLASFVARYGPPGGSGGGGAS